MTKNNDLEKAKELLRQGELRINGILQFSKEIDDKILKLFPISICASYMLLFFILKNYQTMNQSFLYTSIFSFILLHLATTFLLLAGKPARYKGVGLPLKEFDDNRTLKEILFDSKKRYEARFNDNLDLNNKKVFWLKRATYTLYLLPILSFVFYVQLLFFQS